MNRRNLLAFIVSFALLVTVIILNRVSFNQMRTFSGWVDHTREVITSLESISNDFKSAQIYTPTLDTGSLHNYYQLYKNESQEISSKLNDLKKLVKDNAAQSEHMRHLSEMINSELPTLMQKNIA